MHREKESEDHGFAIILPQEPVQVNTCGTWVIKYTVGKEEIQNGGRVRITIPHGFTAPQAKAFFDPGFVTAETEAEGVELAIEIISDILSDNSLRLLVIDPVIISSSGYPLLEEKGVNTLKKRLIPLAEVITPNLMEASALSGMNVKNVEHMKDAAKVLFDLGAAHVLITGGHLQVKPTDMLFDGREFTFFEGKRIKGIEAHGLGCHFSAALVTLLSQGLVMKEAIKRAKTLISIGLKNFNKIGKGRVIPNIF